MNDKLSILLTGVALLTLGVSAETSAGELPAQASGFLKNNCLDCHNADTQEGDVRLDTYSELGNQEQVALLNRIEEQVYLEQMPPEDEDQPSPEQRKSFMTWLSGQYLSLNIKSQFRDKLRFPSYGNYVNHEKLFSGEIKAKAYSPARRWLVSPKIFMSRVNDVFNLEGSNRREEFLGVTQPFLLPAETGVRYYDNQGLSRGHLLTMLSNAEWIAGKQLWRWAKNIDHDNKFDTLKPHHLPIPMAFSAIAEKQSKPTEQEMLDAINVQFDNVLRRRATDDELREYLSLFQSLLEQSQSVSKTEANAIALRKVLVSVLLETEFLYRLEFGAGKEDTYGRKEALPTGSQLRHFLRSF